MSQQYLGEIRIFSFNFPPKGWVLCNGQILPINQNAALFSLLGTIYGGNGTTTFALPNLQGNVPVHMGPGFTEGQVGGQNTHTLLQTEMASHTHPLNAATAQAGGATNVVTNNLPSNPTSKAFYASGINTSMNPAVVGLAGQSQPHDNMSPYLVLNFCIATVGIFPSRN
jgi:microcystin-dependent protein